MRMLKIGIVALTAAVVIGGFISASRSTNTPAKPLTRADSVAAAEYGCALWTRSHSTLSVAEVLGKYELSGKTQGGHYRVGLDYRAGASGILMHSRCEYQDLGNGKQLLVSAYSSLK